MADIQVGDRFYIWKRTVVVEEILPGGRRGSGEHTVRVHPLDEKGRRVPRKIIPVADYVETRRLVKYGTQLAEGEAAPAQQRTTHVEVAVAEARAKKTSVVTPERRLANRITSTRYRMKNPEKSGRSEWTPAELKDMQDTIDTTVAELAALKEARNG